MRLSQMVDCFPDDTRVASTDATSSEISASLMSGLIFRKTSTPSAGRFASTMSQRGLSGSVKHMIV